MIPLSFLVGKFPSAGLRGLLLLPENASVDMPLLAMFPNEIRGDGVLLLRHFISNENGDVTGQKRRADRTRSNLRVRDGSRRGDSGDACG